MMHKNIDDLNSIFTFLGFLYVNFQYLPELKSKSLSIISLNINADMRINPILSDDSIISGVDKVLKVIPDNRVMIKPVRNDS
jgi:hypothetical protein